jgi:hypothetical protein
METTIRIKIDELTPEFIDRIKAFFKNEEELEITVSPVNDFGLTKKESHEEYVNRIKRAIDNIEANKNTIVLSEEEFEALTRDLSHKK